MAETGALPSILQTRLFLPPFIEDYVPRPRVRDRLKQVRRSPLSLICAPAGYGISVLLSTWYAEHDYIEEAVRHSLAANDVAAALELVAASRHELINQESFQRLSRWLKMFSQEVIEGSPDLLLIQARFAQTVRPDIRKTYRLAELIVALIKRLHLETQTTQLFSAENEALRSAVFFYIAPDPQVSLTCGKNALKVLPQHWHTMRSYCSMCGAVVMDGLAFTLLLVLLLLYAVVMSIGVFFPDSMVF